MINKTNLWFLTLSSIILVLAIYYIAIPGETINAVFSANGNETPLVNSIEESEVLTAMRVTKEEELLKNIKSLQDVLLNEKTSLDEKNDAYEQIQFLNANKALEEKLETSINSEYKVSSFVQITDNKIKVVIANKEDSYTLANNIIALVNKNAGDNYYVTVKFE